ncbi:MAG: inactive transglutaminase family protein [Xanthomonadales bacterium]|nr:inactive transglutaminase family protein [Xanthomonadales bacterium]
MLRNLHLVLLAALLTLLGGGAIAYKASVLGLPLLPDEQAEVWTVQARVHFQPRRQANSVRLRIPRRTPGFTIIDERFIAPGYAMLAEEDEGGRSVRWTIRRASGPQYLYFRATVVRGGSPDLQEGRPVLAERPALEEPFATAAAALLEEVRQGSADIASFARELVRRFNEPAPSQEVALLTQLAPEPLDRARLLTGLLAMRSIPARVIQGLPLAPGPPRPLRALLQVHNEQRWVTVDPETAAEGWPEDFLLWTVGAAPPFAVENHPRATLELSVERNLADALLLAEQRLEAANRELFEFSLFALPLETQQVYRVLLMIPVGAFIMLLMRNVVGVSTFGTFMPILIAIAFRDTGLLAGIVMFTVLIAAGLLARFYMERLKLLLVPRLTSVLIVVVILMAAFSVLSHRLGIEVGLSVALFPMVIMAMTIERMSIAWEERGPGHAIRQGAGSLAIAAVAYLLMTWTPLVHFVFVFPEALLIVLAAAMLIGRYSGYRLTELLRFRALARPAEGGPG